MLQNIALLPLILSSLPSKYPSPKCGSWKTPNTKKKTYEFTLITNKAD